MNQLWLLIVLCILFLIPSIRVMLDTARTISNNRSAFLNGNKRDIKPPLDYSAVNTLIYCTVSFALTQFANKYMDLFPSFHRNLYTAEQTATMLIFVMAYLMLLGVLSRGPTQFMDVKTYKSYEFRSIGLFIGFIGCFVLQPILLGVMAVISLTT